MPVAFDYINPPLPNPINGRDDFTSQRFEVGPGSVRHNFSHFTR